ncbi:MAG: hypothetical protein ABJL44_05945 [Algibacter sp.]
MRKLLLTLSCVLTLSFLTSCSEDEINQDVDLLGVWETTDISENSIDTYMLVFGTDNTGLRISESEFNSGEIISNAIPFNWTINDKVVMLLDDETSKNTYVINDEGQLVLSTSEDLRLEKVSNDYSKYY